jgi:hypothetical protein
MITVKHLSTSLEIHPVTPDNLDAVLEVYRGCEDFLALGPVATASMQMVLSDLELSKSIGATFCGIHTPDGSMIGVLDYIPGGYQGNPQAAYLSLLMIAASWRNQGVGDAVVIPKAVRFWQRHGYRITSEPKLYPDGTTAVDLQKDI